jgi:hypothetical protein
MTEAYDIFVLLECPTHCKRSVFSLILLNINDVSISKPLYMERVEPQFEFGGKASMLKQTKTGSL